MSDYYGHVDCYECRKLTSGRCAQHSQWVIGSALVPPATTACILCDARLAEISRLQGENSKIRSALTQIEQEMRAEILRVRGFRAGPMKVQLAAKWADALTLLVNEHEKEKA